MRGSLAMLVVLLAAGCGDDPSGPAPLDTYILQTIDRHPLPYLFNEDANVREEVVSGRIVLFDDGSFADHIVFRTTGLSGSAEEEVRLFGAYEVEGDGITFSIPGEDGNPGGDVYTGQLVGDELQVSATTLVWYYER